MHTIYAHHDADKFRLGIPTVKVGLTETGTEQRIIDSLHAGDAEPPRFLAEIQSLYLDGDIRIELVKNGWRRHLVGDCGICKKSETEVPGTLPKGHSHPKEWLHPPVNLMASFNDCTKSVFVDYMLSELQKADSKLRENDKLDSNSKGILKKGTPRQVVTKVLQLVLPLKAGILYVEDGDGQEEAESCGSFAHSFSTVLKKLGVDAETAVKVHSSKLEQATVVLAKRLGVRVLDNTPEQALMVTNERRISEGKLPLRTVEVIGNPPYSLGMRRKKGWFRMVGQKFALACFNDPKVSAVTYVTPINQIPAVMIPNIVRAVITEGNFGMGINMDHLAIWRWERNPTISGCLLTDTDNTTTVIDPSNLDFLPLRYLHLEAVLSVKPFQKIRAFTSQAVGPKTDLQNLNTGDSEFGKDDKKHLPPLYLSRQGDPGGEFVCCIPDSRGNYKVPVTRDHLCYLRKEMLDEGMINLWKAYGSKFGSGGAKGTEKFSVAGPGETLKLGSCLYFTASSKKELENLSKIWLSTPIQFLIHVAAAGVSINSRCLRFVPRLDYFLPVAGNVNVQIYQQLKWSSELVHLAENTLLNRKEDEEVSWS
jgi:hypothetical protein